MTHGPLPLGATATVVVERRAAETPMAAIPAGALTQASASRRSGSFGRDDTGVGTVELVPVAVHGYRNDEVLVSGAAGRRAGGHRRGAEDGAGLPVALPVTRARSTDAKQAAR